MGTSFGQGEKIVNRNLTCPNDGEEYRAGSPFTPGSKTDRHPISTSQYVDRRDGELVLVIGARCQCGWSEVEVLRP